MKQSGSSFAYWVQFLDTEWRSDEEGEDDENKRIGKICS